MKTPGQAVATAIAAYESTDEFAPLDSGYDRYLRGEAELAREAGQARGQ